MQEQQNLQKQIEQLELIAKQRMTPEALSRYGNLKAAHPEKAIQSIVIIVEMVQQGKLSVVTDEEYKKLLQYMTPEKKEFKITRK
tara:strand:+ start:346 stop:600 length:255 start_codon:yes stop_codon:yes gene_type:complete